MGSFSSELGVKFSIQLEANHVINKSQVSQARSQQRCNRILWVFWVVLYKSHLCFAQLRHLTSKHYFLSPSLLRFGWALLVRDPMAENSVLLSSTLKLIPSRMRWGRCCYMSARSWPRACSAFCHLIRYLDNLLKQEIFLLAFKMIRQCTVLKSLAFDFFCLSCQS